MKKLILIATACAFILACAKEKVETNNVYISNTWKPVHLGAGNNALNAKQIGSQYYIGFSESLLSLNAAGENRVAMPRSYSYMPYGGAPGMAFNTIAYLSRDSVYIGKITNLDRIKAVTSLSDLGVNGFTYVHQLADKYSDGIMVNEFNEMIIPLYKPFSSKLAYAYLSVVGDVADTLPVFLGQSGTTDEINGLEEGEISFKKVIQADNAFFFLAHKSGLYKVQRNFVLKTLLATNILDVFKHGNKLAAVVKDSLVNRLYLSSSNGESWNTVNNFPALDTLSTCSRSFFSDGTEIFSYSDCVDDGLLSHKLVGSSVVTRKLKVDGVDGYEGTGMIIESDRILFATRQGVFAAKRDSIYEEDN